MLTSKNCLVGGPGWPGYTFVLRSIVYVPYAFIYIVYTMSR